MDEYGNPIYGDVFGVYGSKEHDDMTPYDAAVDKTKRWGQLEELSESESEYEEDDEDDEQDGTELGDDDVTAGISSMSSLQTGVETPAAPLDLRKRRVECLQLIRVLFVRHVQNARHAHVALLVSCPPIDDNDCFVRLLFLIAQ